ncbi:MAG: Hsp20/alpha crystallin family protein, partial [Planctomycetota bacterium]
MVRFHHHPQSVIARHGLDGLFRVAESLHAQMNQVAEGGTGESVLRSYSPKAELTSSEDAAKLVMLIPGFGPEHLDISVERASVLVKGEREDGPAATRFERTFRLPFPVDADQSEATVELGV